MSVLVEEERPEKDQDWTLKAEYANSELKDIILISTVTKMLIPKTVSMVSLDYVQFMSATDFLLLSLLHGPDFNSSADYKDSNEWIIVRNNKHSSKISHS